jgi:hypothetical protein
MLGRVRRHRIDSNRPQVKAFGLAPEARHPTRASAHAPLRLDYLRRTGMDEALAEEMDGVGRAALVGGIARNATTHIRWGRVPKGHVTDIGRVT